MELVAEHEEGPPTVTREDFNQIQGWRRSRADELGVPVSEVSFLQGALEYASLPGRQVSAEERRRSFPQRCAEWVPYMEARFGDEYRRLVGAA
jgi:hypothetical protein